ncbi:MAG: FAD-dependent oxidoreductase [Acidaminobacteraceae bacterium]
MVGKRVVILGSGDIGLIMARRMTLEGAKVLAVAEVMPFSGGLMRNIVQCLDDFDIPLMLSHTVTEIKGYDRVEGVVISQVDENLKPIPGTEISYECDTLLLSVGLIPENELSREAGILIDKSTNGPIVNEAMETSISGIFACGNVVHVHDLVDFVTAESKRAGSYAAEYVLGTMVAEAESLITVPGNGISYIVPQKIRVENLSDKVTFFMRVNKTFSNVSLVVKTGDKVVREFKRKHLAPGEMESIELEKEILEAMGLETLTIEVRKEA